VPLIVRWPERWKGGQRRGHVCSLLDLVQTIIELAGAKPDPKMDGTSLTPILDDPTSTWPDFAVSEYHGHAMCTGIYMIRQGHWKYVYHAALDERLPAERELYDLESDPGEMRNLAEQPERQDRVEAMHQALFHELGEPPEQIEERRNRELNTPYDRSLIEPQP
jgi:choline-sulfatase